MAVKLEKSWPELLGDTPDEIAKTLLEQGVRGVPGDCKQCIIARSYKYTYPDGWGGLRASYRRPKKGDQPTYCTLTFDDCQIMDPQGSAALAEFMYRFDLGEYPALSNRPIPDRQVVLDSLTIEEQIALGY